MLKLAVIILEMKGIADINASSTSINLRFAISVNDATKGNAIIYNVRYETVITFNNDQRIILDIDCHIYR